MNESTMPFDHRPDPVLGAALRAALAPGERAAFVGRVLAAADRPATPVVEVLARWSRLGIAAALLAALAAGFAVGRGRASPEIAVVTPDATELGGAAVPDAVTLLASFPDR